MTLDLLVTGAAGFVGQVVVELAVARGHRVTATDSAANVVFPAGVHLVAADIRDRDMMRQAAADCTAIIHCAAVVGPKPATADPVLATEVNVEGTLSVLEAARSGGQNVVYLSTATLYGHRPGLESLDESAPCDPIGIYDATKYMAETLCTAYRKSYATAVSSIRTGFVYGAGHSTGDYYVDRLLAGETHVEDVGADHPCDFTYVWDLARALMLAAESGPLPEPVYNATGGVLRTRGDLAEIVLSHFPNCTIFQRAGVDPVRHLRGVCLLARAERDFGYRPKFSLEDGIADWIDRARMTQWLNMNE